MVLAEGLNVVAAAGVTRQHLLMRMGAAVSLTWAIGFERELRGSSAGDRTFALVGLGSAIVGFLALNHAPNALAGVITGVGFLGAGVMIHGGSSGDSMVHGITTAATIYLAAAVGAAAGQGELLLAAVCAFTAIFLLEIRHIRTLRWLDGKHWAERFAADDDMASPPLPPKEPTGP